jgi:formylglycine-generating enzyme required for sulfatase activity
MPVSKAFGLMSALALGLTVAPALFAADGPKPATASGPATQPASAPVYSAWPFDPNEAARRQDETARALGVKKEQALDLGNRVTMKLALIPAGTFLMGSPKDEKDRGDNEAQHEVTLSKPFYMGIYTVTQQQYEQVMRKNPSGFKGATNPVEMMSWDDAVSFCKALSTKTGKAVRLPTEAEWEFACRAGSGGPYFHGDDADPGKLDNYAWYAANSGNKTHPVGQKKPNAFGLFDMHGNVLQWCADWLDKDYYGNSPKSDPQGPATGTFRVLRGGSWPSNPSLCRSPYRTWNVPTHTVGKIGSFGFRIVVEVGTK